MKNSKNFFQIVVLSAIFVFTAGVACYLGNKNKPVPNPIAISTPDPTIVNWKTYTDQKYGFSLKYPSKTTLVETDRNTINFYSKTKSQSGPYFYIVIENNKTMLEMSPRERVTLGPIVWDIFIKQECSEHFCGPEIVFYQVVKNGLTFSVVFVSDQSLTPLENQTYFNQTLSTFQFTK